MKVAVTGAGGLIGLHVLCRLSAYKKFELRPVYRESFASAETLASALDDPDCIVHAAARNRGSEAEVAGDNDEITGKLVSALAANPRPRTIIFTSSVKAEDSGAYGLMKRNAEARLNDVARTSGGRFVSLVLPHVFGEQGKPFSNSAVHTFCAQWARGEEPFEVNASGELELLHAQDVATKVERLLTEESNSSGRIRMRGQPITVGAVNALIRTQAEAYRRGVVPAFADALELNLFNTLRAFFYSQEPRLPVDEKRDQRGVLFEAVRSLGMGQAFVSWTEPGFTRGNHFHFRKIERFCVLQGQAEIKIRRLFSSEVRVFRNEGRPLMIDMPTLHTHNIKNIGAEPLVTLFWANEIFDPQAPDTYPEQV